jgi:hypothetical protein
VSTSGDRTIVRELAVPAILVVSVLALVGYRTFSVFFAVDDLVYLVSPPSRWPGFTEAAANRWLSGPAAFAAGRALFGPTPSLFHLPLILGHGLNALLLWALVRRLAPTHPLLATVSAVVFAGHAAAYTALAWLSAGMNEVPTLTAALLAVHLALSSMHGRPWLAFASAALVAVGAGLKQHIVVTVVYGLVFGAWYARYRLADRPRSTWLPGLAITLVLMSALCVWMALFVQPRMPVGFRQEPYTRVYAATSVVDGYLRYLPHALNPLATGRESLGYQGDLPAGLDELVRPNLMLFRALVTAGSVLLIAVAARVLQLSLLALGSAFVLLGALFLPASMPRHQYDYYVYFGLPVASLLMAMPMVGAARYLRGRFDANTRWLLPLSVGVAVVAFVQGRVLHDSNDLVAVAAHMQLVDRMAADVADGGTMYFVPPVGAVHEATLSGASIAILRPAKRLKVWFAERDGAPDVFAGSQGVTLVQTRKLPGPHWQGAILDRANWRRPVTRLQLDAGQEFVQPFSSGPERVEALEFPAEWYGRGCVGEFALEGPVADEATSPSTVARGSFDCRSHVRDGVARVPIPSINLQPTGVYELRLRIRTGSLRLALAATSSDVVRAARYRHGTVVESITDMIGLHVIKRVVAN